MPRPVPPIDGLCVIDKAAGWTSHDVVAKARGVLGTRKIGHSGTLDPDATGVLLLGVGAATRLLRFLTALPKTYSGSVVLGTTTTTLDASGEVTATYDMGGVDLAAVRAAAARFVGPILQVPPMVSAVKVGGRRLHELARAGIEVERAARPVTVYRLEVEPSGDEGVFRVEVACSSGTYVRSLAADIGTALGGGAHLRDLRRIAVGAFGEAEAHPVESPELLPMAEVMRGHPRIDLDEAAAGAVRHGSRLPASVAAGASAPTAGPGAVPRPAQGAAEEESGPERDGQGGTALPVALFGPDGRLLGVYERRGADWLVPVVVLAGA